MGLWIESLRRRVGEVLPAVRGAFSVPAEKFVEPSPVSFWINDQKRFPFRRALANLVEDIRVSAFTPFNLARGVRKNNGINGFAAAILVGGIPLGTGMEVGFVLGNPLIGALVAGACYMTEGYLLYRPCAANVEPYRKVLNAPC